MNTIDKEWVEKHIDSNGEVIIPEGIEKIEQEAFKENELVKKVIMPDSVIEIGDSAFSGCSNLQDVKLSNKIKLVGEEAFFDCKVLTSIELPKSIEKIDEAAFACCEKLEKVLIDREAKIKELQDNIFYECKKLKEISIPNSVEKIGENAFHECSSLEKLSIPDSIKEIKSKAFSYCSELKNVEIGEKSQLEKLGDNTFYLCKELEKIKLPDGLKKLEKATFIGCYKLSSIELGNEIENIDYDVFNSCKSLKSITLPNTVRKIGACAFYNCESLKEIIGGENIDEIQTGAFENTSFETFKVPKKVKEIEYETFGNCKELREFYFGENMEQLGSLALNGCSNLKKLSINEKLTYFPMSALEGVDSLEEIEINGTERINYESFKGKDSIRKITIDGNEYVLEENEKLYSFQKHNEKVAIVVNKDGKNVTRCLNLEKGKDTRVNANIYLTNYGDVVRAINSTANISIEQLQKLKENEEKSVYICGATRDIKPYEHQNGMEVDLYDIDDLIQIKKIIENMKEDIVIPPEDDKHRQKKIYSQIVRKLSERMEYDFYEEYQNAKSEQKKEVEKNKYEKITGKNWEEYIEQNKDVDIEKMMLEDGNLLGLLNGKAVCRGNVEIIRNLAAEFGIEATTIIGRGHTWNQVKLDGLWYDDDFTNYQTFLANGNLKITSKRFLCGKESGESVFSKIKGYSLTLNKPKDVGKNYSLEDKKFLLNYGYENRKENEQIIQPIEKKQEKQESIKDEIGDEIKPKTEQQEQEEKQVETMWQNRFQAWDRDAVNLPNSAKRKEEAVQIMKNIDKEKELEEQRKQEEIEEQDDWHRRGRR